jgi:hypothetical protein
MWLPPIKSYAEKLTIQDALNPLQPYIAADIIENAEIVLINPLCPPILGDF